MKLWFHLFSLCFFCYSCRPPLEVRFINALNTYDYERIKSVFHQEGYFLIEGDTIQLKEFQYTLRLDSVSMVDYSLDSIENQNGNIKLYLRQSAAFDKKCSLLQPEPFQIHLKLKSGLIYEALYMYIPEESSKEVAFSKSYIGWYKENYPEEFAKATSYYDSLNIFKAEMLITAQFNEKIEEYCDVYFKD